MTIQNNADYYRAGVAIRMDKKHILDERLGLLGLKTVGSLTNLLIDSDESIIAVLKPYAESLVAKKSQMRSGPSKTAMLTELKEFSSEQLAAILATHKAGLNRAEV